MTTTLAGLTASASAVAVVELRKFALPRYVAVIWWVPTEVKAALNVALVSLSGSPVVRRN